MVGSHEGVLSRAEKVTGSEVPFIKVTLVAKWREDRTGEAEGRHLRQKVAARGGEEGWLWVGQWGHGNPMSQAAVLGRSDSRVSFGSVCQWESCSRSLPWLHTAPRMTPGHHPSETSLVHVHSMGTTVAVPPKLYSTKPTLSHLAVPAGTMPLSEHWEDGVSEAWGSGRRKRQVKPNTQS